jgi:hypothetical protein
MQIWMHLTQNYIEYFHIIKARNDSERTYQLKQDYITQAFETIRIFIRRETEKICLHSKKFE